MERRAPNHYAILVGIDAYPGSPLTACVRDVQKIKEVLQAQTFPVHIEALVATASVEPGSSKPMEDPKSWPTYHNVTSTLEKITSLAKPGDYIYIHFSGHGTRMEASSEFSDHSTGDLALVLLDGNKQNNVRYLWGPRLAFSLKHFVDKGMVVTLVLDCCFSASVYRREDTNVRFLPWDPEVDSLFSRDPDQTLEQGSSRAASRDASMLPNWLISPDRCVILTACGPHEVASELRTRDGQIHGALSYFLLPLMKSGGFLRKHKDIYRHLCNSFRQSWPRQNPVLYGNKDQGFFGQVDLKVELATIPVTFRGNNLQLQAGEAHGVCDGDLFAITTHEAAGTTRAGQARNPVIAKAMHTRGLTSTIRSLESNFIPQRHEGLIAEPLGPFFLRNFPLRFAHDLPQSDEWLGAFRERSFGIYTDKEEDLSSYQLALNSNDEFIILDEHGAQLINIPTLPRYNTNVNDICGILEHLARNRLFRDLVNRKPSDTFINTFDAHIINRSGRVFRPGCVVNVKEDDGAKFTFELYVENLGKNPLYVFIYNMGPFWEVEDIYRGSYAVIPPKDYSQGFSGVSRKRLKTMVPVEMKGMGHFMCRDLVRVFITSQPTSFEFLELPKLGATIKRNTKPRVATEDSNASEEWVALSFPICTYSREVAGDLVT